MRLEIGEDLVSCLPRSVQGDDDGREGSGWGTKDAGEGKPPSVEVHIHACDSSRVLGGAVDSGHAEVSMGD